MGGIPIFLGFLFSISIWFKLEDFYELRYLAASLILMFIIGLRDDLIPLRARYKLFSQIIPTLMIIFLADIELTSFYGLIDTGTFPKLVSVSVTIFTIVVITNSFNLIDGIDGLAGTAGVITLSFFGGWFFFTGNYFLSYLIFAFVGAVIAFLFFNWAPSKIFMGDTGALLMGFLLSFVTISFINANFALPDNDFFKFKSSISTAVCVLILPLFDTLRVFILRVRRGESPFSADNNHIHHLLLRMGMSHAEATLTLGALNIVFLGIAVLGNNLGDYILLPIIIALCLIINYGINFLLKKREVLKAKTKKTAVQ
ncbi:MAG: MraY family glycosyltransferase [Bacteroidota bacterium]